MAFVNVASDGSQFRSRDIFPQAFAAVVQDEPGALAEVLEPRDIPAVPERVIAYRYGFGNLKTTLQAADIEVSGTLEVTLAGVTRQVTVADGSFSVPQGQLTLAPGSSGWLGPDGRRRRWLELFLRGGSAYEAFGRPEIGAPLTVAG